MTRSPNPHRRRLRRGVAVVATATAAAVVMTVALTGVGSSGAQPSATPLSSELDSILGASVMSGTSYGLTVRDAATGRTLYDAQGAQRLIPASNAKLFTSTAALDTLGPDFRFRTTVAERGRRHGKVLDGNIYLKGYGDPMATASVYKKLAAQLAATGVRVVRGALVADDTYFDSARLAPFWSWDDEPYYYSAQTSALNVAPDRIGDTGTVLVDVFPADHVGGRPRVTMTPRNSYVHIRNDATTGAVDSARTIRGVREYGRNVVHLTGSIPLGASNYATQPTVNEPTRLVASLFRKYLGQHGITVRRPTRYRATPSTAQVVATHKSQPLSQILTPFLKLSNNMIAEALTKAMGAKTTGTGSWAAGTAAIMDAAAADGLDTSTLQLFDGSGLGRADYLTTDQITTLLEAVRDKPWFRTWYDALPIAGEPASLVGGTLRHRLAGTAAADNLHGKTGSETGVNSLSGYVTDAAGEKLVFSFLNNNYVEGGITAVEDQVALALAQYGSGSGSSSRTMTPQVRRAATPAGGRRAQLECSWTRSC